MPSINNLPPLTNVTGTVAFPVVDYSVDPDATKRATFLQFRDYLETTAAVKSVAGRIGVITLSTSDIAGLNIISWQGIQPATSNTVGGVKVGTGLNVTSSGTLSLNTSTLVQTAVSILTTASATVLGGVKIGENLSITGDGTLNATSAYILTTATTSTLGGVKIGNGITINDGVISTTPLTTATTSTLGGIIVGSGLTISPTGVLTAESLSAVQTTSTFVRLNAESTQTYVVGDAPWTGYAGFLILRGTDITNNAAGLLWNDNYYINDGILPSPQRGIWQIKLGIGKSSGLTTDFIRLDDFNATGELNIFGSNDPTAVMSVKGTTDYENQVIHDDHIPNKKYVDTAQTNDTTNNFKMQWTTWAATSATTLGYTGTYGGGLFIGDIGSAKDTNILIGSENGKNITLLTEPNGIGGWNHYGVYNVAIGQGAGRSLTTGSNNVYIGNSAGGWQTWGSNNIAIGEGAGAVTAYYGVGEYTIENIAIGRAALAGVYGDRNIGMGTFAGNNLGVGSENVIFGSDDGQSVTNSNKNVIIADNRAVPGEYGHRKVLWNSNGKMFHYGDVSITSSTVSISTSTGALTVAGGAGIAGDLYVGQSIISGNITATGVVNIVGSAFLNGYAISTGTGGGSALTIKEEGGDLTTQATSINFVGAGVIATTVGNDVTVTISGGGGGGSFSGGTVQNIAQFLDASASSSSATGAVSIVGGLGVGRNSFFGSEVTIKAATPTISSATGAVTVVGGVGVGGGIFVNGAITATNALISSTVAATSSTGALRVEGGISVGGSVYVANTVTAVTFANAGAGTPTIQSPSSIILDAQTEVKVLGSPFTLWSRTVAQLLVTSATAGAMAYCTNESGGAVPVFYDGSDWRRVTDRNIIS